jgi:hypothetical protein
MYFFDSVNAPLLRASIELKIIHFWFFLLKLSQKQHCHIEQINDDSSVCRSWFRRLGFNHNPKLKVCFTVRSPSIKACVLGKSPSSKASPFSSAMRVLWPQQIDTTFCPCNTEWMEMSGLRHRRTWLNCGCFGLPKPDRSSPTSTFEQAMTFPPAGVGGMFPSSWLDNPRHYSSLSVKGRIPFLYPSFRRTLNKLFSYLPLARRWPPWNPARKDEWTLRSCRHCKPSEHSTDMLYLNTKLGLGHRMDFPHGCAWSDICSTLSSNQFYAPGPYSEWLLPLLSMDC